MIFFVSRIRMETDERKNWKGLFPSSRVESSRVAGTRVDASRDGKQNEQQIGSWWLLHTFRDS